jgi:hypothetical protein
LLVKVRTSRGCCFQGRRLVHLFHARHLRMTQRTWWFTGRMRLNQILFVVPNVRYVSSSKHSINEANLHSVDQCTKKCVFVSHGSARHASSAIRERIHTTFCGTFCSQVHAAG